MNQSKVNHAALTEARQKASLIRNVCILAHVDHGKTTIADLLLSMNNIVSRKSVGKARYLDDRPDEQERGITMKSSGVSLFFAVMDNDSDEKEYIQLNLIDTPGHIDFSSEVSAAVRVCDGAIIVVDVVEGMCSQTQAAINQAYTERLQMILILNKMDRLILEQKKTPEEIMTTLLRIVEDLNAYIAELQRFDFARRVDLDANAEMDELPLFNPASGNVIFASAIDGWGFTLGQIAQMFSKLFRVDVYTILNKMWDFDWYFDKKSNKLRSGAVEKNKRCLFLSMVIDTVYSLYDTIVVRQLSHKMPNIMSRFGISQTTRDMNSTDSRVALRAVMNAWRPISDILMSKIADVILAPTQISDAKIKHLLGLEFCADTDFSMEIAKFTRDQLKLCSSEEHIPVIAYVSKTFCVNKKNLSQNKPRRLSPGELRKRRAKIIADLEARKWREEQAKLSQKATISEGIVIDKYGLVDSISKMDISDEAGAEACALPEEAGACALPEGSACGPLLPPPVRAPFLLEEVIRPVDVAAEALQKKKHVCVPLKVTHNDPELMEGEFPVEVIAFTRIFSGVIRSGQLMYILPNDYSPLIYEEFDTDSACLAKHPEIKEITIKALYTLMGRELVYAEYINAGNVCGIGGLEQHLLRTGTLVSSLKCAPLVETCVAAEPMIRNAIEPVRPEDMPVLRRGLKHLMQSDSCLQVLINEQGEHILLSAGDVHLAKCLEDLRNFYAPIDIKLSMPMVSLRETVVLHDDGDANAKPMERIGAEIDEYEFAFEVTCVQIPHIIRLMIKEHITLLHMVEKHQTAHPSELLQKVRSMLECTVHEVPPLKTFSNPHTSTVVKDLHAQLACLFAALYKNWEGYLTHIWSVDKSKENINLLINDDDEYPYRSIYRKLDETDVRSCFDHCIVNAFEMVCKSGPMCEEPLMNVAFIVKRYDFDKFDPRVHGSFADVCAKITSVTREVMRKAVKQFGRLMEPIFVTEITVDTGVLGRVYDVIHKRHGKIREALNQNEAKKSVIVNAEIPVVESIGFCNEIRKCSSGKANPNLRFSHFETLPGDPNYPIAVIGGEEIDNSRTFKLLCDTRRRKGLIVDEQLVRRAEKQRTLNKKK